MNLIEVVDELEAEAKAKADANAKDAPAAKADTTPKRGASKDKKFDLPAFFRAHGIDASEDETWRAKSGSGTRWELKTCPMNSAHADGAAYVVQHASGAISAGCHHNSCQNWGWAELREKVEPGYREKRDRARSGNRIKSTGTRKLDTDWQPEALTQLDNARRLAAILGGNARYNASRGEWMYFDGTRFAIDEKGYVESHAKQVARDTLAFIDAPPPGTDYKSIIKHVVDSNKAGGINAAMRLTEREPGIPVVADELDSNPFKLNVRNGTIELDLRSGHFGEIRPHDRGDLITKLAPIEFDPMAECHLWDGCFDTWMAGDQGLIGYLQRLVGVLLTGDISVQEFWILWGSGANGKSVFLDTIVAMLGDYAGTAAPSLLTSRTNDEHPTEIADLAGRRVIVASETEENARLKVQLVKRLTGDATLKGRFMRQDYFEFPRTHKTLLATNNRPQIRESTNAVWRRVRLVPFAVTIPPDERDPNLLKKLRDEWPGILNWAIAGCWQWQKHGMQTPAAVTLATKDYQHEQDVLGDFVAERCITGPEAKVSRADLYAAYTTWAKSIGDAHPMERPAFFDRVRRVEGVDEAKLRMHGQATRMFTGVGVKTTAADYAESQTRLAGQK